MIAVLALVGVGIGIGYSAWGSSAPASASAPAQPSRPSRPAFPVPPASKTAFLGVEISGGGFVTGTSKGAQGARVIKVVAGSPAEKAGIRAGDTITRFGGRHVASGLTLQFDVQHDSPGQRVGVTWTTTTGATRSATVTLATRPASRSIG